MKIVLKKEWYKGTDGSSLSEERCVQFIQLYDYCVKLGSKIISYKDLQNLALEDKLYGSTDAAKAIRTFCPLLSKIGFINYQGKFPANKLFTNDGDVFIQTLKALELAKRTRNSEIISELQQTKQGLQRLGLLNMRDSVEYVNHNIWIALGVLDEFGEIEWDEFGYFVYMIKGYGLSIREVQEKIDINRVNSVKYEYLKEDGNRLANTYYSYIHSFLVESGIISDYTKGISLLCDEAHGLLKTIKDK